MTWAMIFFALWLDPRMQYSSAIFEQPGMSLDAAQLAKLDRLCQKLALCEDDHLLEIGTGWGGLALHAAQHYGCRVTTTTISAEQYQYARERVEDAGLQDRITLLQKDYRDLSGSFDKLVSVEMLEAVGHEFHGTFFRKCCDLLKPDGLMVLQTITIADQRFERARRSVDFIQRYIFPGRVSAFRHVHEQYPERRNRPAHDSHRGHRAALCNDPEASGTTGCSHAIDDVRALGYSSEFVRLWQYYLCYCEGGFLERVIGNVQFIAMRPQNRHRPFLA